MLCYVPHRGGCLSLKIILKRRAHTSSGLSECRISGVEPRTTQKSWIKREFHNNFYERSIDESGQKKCTLTFSGKFFCEGFPCGTRTKNKLSLC